MPKRLTRLQIVRRRDPQTQAVNEKIAQLAAVKPWGDVYAAFALAAHLATQAIEAAQELQQMPGASVREIQPTLEFWCKARDFNHTAALAVAGGNQNLAAALVTFRFLQTSAENTNKKEH
jgi:hypothetical protein